MTTTSALQTDVLIIGAGPVGLYGAYYAGFRGLRTIVVDSLPQVGGQVMALYPEKEIRDVAELPSVRGRDFIAALEAQAAPLQPDLSARAPWPAQSRLRRRGEPGVGQDDGTAIHARAIVLSGGIGTPNPRPLLCGHQWLHTGLSYFVADPEAHRGQDVVIVGGGDSALDWAVMLKSLARSVTLIHRRTSFRAHAATLAEVRSNGTTIITNAEVVGFHGDVATGRLEKVTVRENGSEERLVAADHVIAALGFISELGPLRDWGLELNSRSVLVDRTMRTNQPRIFAAGDLADYPGKVKLISVGFGEVATAVNHAAAEISPDQPVFPGHSTDS